MIDHTGIGVSDVEVCAKFFDAICTALGMKRVMEMRSQQQLDGVGYGFEFPIFWIDRFHPAGQKYHTAFRARSCAEVDAFFKAGLAAGGTANGAPGYRRHQSTSTYYAAFLLDPDGNNIEAVFRNL